MTKIMGILNVTPDSYYDGGRYHTVDRAVQRGIRLAEEGADWIDVGGESTRPGAQGITVEEELSRVIPVIEQLKRTVTTPLSIDTRKPEVAARVIEAGASMINDVSGFRHEGMVQVAVDTQVPVCVMHMQNRPDTMQDAPQYPDGVVATVCNYLNQQAKMLMDAGVKKENIFLDPGIGFGKSVADNYEILHNLEQFQSLGFPLLIGLSRKSLLNKVIGKAADSEEALAATKVMNALVIQAGVEMIRVHDVKAHREIMEVLGCRLT